MVTRKQGCGEEGDSREAGEEKQGKTRRWVSMEDRGDLGKIQGRSIDLWGSVFRSIRERNEGARMEGGGDEGKGFLESRERNKE